MPTSPQPPFNMNSQSPVELSQAEREQGLVGIVYVCQVLGFFVFVPFFAALIINLIKGRQMTTVFARSHMSWQLRTAVWGILWSVIGLILAFVFVGLFVLGIVTIWMIYRVVKGCLAYRDGQVIGKRFKKMAATQLQADLHDDVSDASSGIRANAGDRL